MSTSTDDSTPDGSTNISDEQKNYTDSLGDGSPTGSATTDPAQDSDAASGGEPDDTTTTKPEDVDLESRTDPDGTPVENPSG